MGRAHRDKQRSRASTSSYLTCLDKLSEEDELEAWEEEEEQLETEEVEDEDKLPNQQTITLRREGWGDVCPETAHPFLPHLLKTLPPLVHM